jgi:hypothetical protein
MSQHTTFLRSRLSDNSKFQLTLGIHFALLVLLAATHRQLRAHGSYESRDAYRLVTGLCAGVFLAQICLVGCWAAFSRASSALRIGLLVLFAPLLAAVQSQVFNETNVFVWWVAWGEDYLLRYTIWAVELSLFAFAIALCGWGFRLLGFRLSLPDSATGRESWWQWGLKDLAGWFVVMGLLLAAHNWLREFGWSWRRGLDAVDWALEGSFDAQSAFAFLTLLLVVGILFFRTSRLGLAVMILAPLAFSLVDGMLRDRRPNVEAMSREYAIGYVFSDDTVAVMYYTFTFVFGGTLLVVRDCGYRLRWRKPWTSPPVAEST